MMKRLPLAIILITQLYPGGFAQQPTPTPAPSPSSQEKPKQPESDDVVRITTNLVQVDVVITDKDGRLVTDLKPEEVEIYEDGREQKITNFSFTLAETEAPPDNKSATVDKNANPTPPRRLKPEDVRRTIALVVDDLGLSFESTYYVRRALKKFVDEQVQSGDLVAIIRTSGGVGALQQFTADKRQLYAAIERVKYYSLGRAGISAFAPIEPRTPGALGEEMDAANGELNQFREDVFAVGTLGAVNYVVRGLRDLPGRKSVLLISDGFRIYSRDDPTRNYRTVERLRRLIDEAGRASVVIYTMNATGLQTFGINAADNLSGRTLEQVDAALAGRRTAAFETQEGLDLLAQETGGIAIRNNNDLSGGIRRMLNDQRGYYLIGYRPDDSTFEVRRGRRQFHRLSLKIKRPGKFNVRMRKGFFGSTDEEQRPKPKTLAQQMVGALISPFGATGVHLRLTSLFANDAKAGSIMRSLLHIDANDLTFTKDPDGAYLTNIDLAAITFGDNGVPVDQLGMTYQLKLSEKDHQRIIREGLVYYVTVPIKKPGAYQLRLSLRDSASERIGSASQFIEVPDIKKKRLMLSGLIVRAKTTADDGRDLLPVADGREEGQAQVSAAVRQFNAGAAMTYAFFIYNARLDKASSRPQLTMQVKLFRDGKEIFVGKEIPFDSSGQTDLQRLAAAGALQLGTIMEPGEYVLQVSVTDPLADKKYRIATQWMDFQIVK